MIKELGFYKLKTYMNEYFPFCCQYGNIVIVLTVDIGDMITTFVKMDM